MLEYIDYWKLCDGLIKRNRTGSVEELAKRLGVSKSTVKNIIKSMRDKLGAPIEYNRDLKSYIYTRKGNLRLGWDESKVEKIGKSLMEVLERELK